MITNVPPATWLGAICSHPEPQIVGRAAECGIRVAEDCLTVSRRHLEIRVDRGRIYIKDLGSKGGTCLNGVFLEPGREIQVVFGDRIGLGGVGFIVVSPKAEILNGPEKDDFAEKPESSIIVTGLRNADTRESRRLRKLTPAELQVVCWMSRGLTMPEEIGAKLFRSPNTVRTQFNNIFRKLHVHSREELLGWLTRNEFSWAIEPRTDESISIHDDDSGSMDLRERLVRDLSDSGESEKVRQ